MGEILSIEEIVPESNAIFLYPNPSRNSFSLNEIEGVSNVQIFDTNGRKVVSYNNVSANLFDVSYLPIGEYIIKIFWDTKISRSFKLIKQ
ncbi:MAG: T9SS type A sorting domain-containing protein [Flavobacteriaceae bacterium]